MGTAIDTRDLDVGDLSLWADGPPHEVFEMLRREEPLHWSELNEFAHERGFWSVVRFDDIAAVGRDHETFSSERSLILADRIFADPDVPDPLDIAQHMMITQDPPRHDRMKALVQQAFTPKRALDHTERMREIINLVYDRALEGSDGQIDLVRDVGWFVPSMVIGDMLGAPREDAAKLVEWTNTTTAFQDPNLVPDLGMVMEALEEFMPYVDALIAEREQRPTDDLTSALIAAEIDGERMPREEILMFFFLLMVAGNDSTRSVFTSGMKSLMEDPEQMNLVRTGAVPLEQWSRKWCGCIQRSRTCGGRPRATPRSRARRSRQATSSRSGTCQATATRASSMILTTSTSAVSRTRIRVSPAGAATSVWVQASPGSS